MKSLGDDIRKTVMRTMDNNYSARMKLSAAVDLSVGPLKRLRGDFENGLLEDEVVNTFLALLQQRHNDQVLADNKGSKYTHFHMSTHFICKLVDDEGDGLRLVERWLKNVNIFELEYLYFPVNTKTQKHWTFAFIEFKSKRIYYLDSLSKQQNLCIGCCCFSPFTSYVIMLLLYRYSNRV